MNFSDLLSQINTDNNTVESQNSTRIDQIWSKIQNTILSDLSGKAQEYQTDNMQVTNIEVDYEEDSDLYDDLSQICKYKDATPNSYLLPVDITRGMIAQVYRSPSKDGTPSPYNKPAVQYIAVSLDTTKSYPDESTDLADPKGVLVEFEGNDIKFEAH